MTQPRNKTWLFHAGRWHQIEREQQLTELGFAPGWRHTSSHLSFTKEYVVRKRAQGLVVEAITEPALYRIGNAKVKGGFELIVYEAGQLPPFGRVIGLIHLKEDADALKDLLPLQKGIAPPKDKTENEEDI